MTLAEVEVRFAGLFFLFILVSSCSGGATQGPENSADDVDNAAVLQRLQNPDETTYDDLKSFVCDESIQRFRSALDGSRMRAIDVVSASLSFESGAEHYSSIRQNSQLLAGISNLTGAWSEGEFGTLLRQTTQLLRVEPVSFRGMAMSDHEPTLIYTFDVPTEDSPWELVLGGNSYRLAFHTEIWVDPTTEQIVRVARTAVRLDPTIGISEIHWSVNLHPVRLLGKEWLLPATAQYAVFYAHSNRREWNEISFTNYRRYGSEVALRFDGP